MPSTQAHKIHPKHSLLAPTETRSWWWDDAMSSADLDQLFKIYGKERLPVETLTLQGRLEFRWGYKPIFSILGKTNGLVSSKFFREDETEWIQVTWLIRAYHYKEGYIDYRADTCNHINQFIDMVRSSPDLHVFLQSLKPVTICDGDRNGLWSTH